MSDMAGSFFVWFREMMNRNCPGCIFTDRRGKLGRALFETMRRDYDKQKFTVNSSPYAVKIYEHLGFQATDTEQLVDGLRFTPMIYKS